MIAFPVTWGYYKYYNCESRGERRMLQEFIAKAIWFLKIYYVENQLLVQFLLLFVITYMLLMYWLNPRLSPVLRKVLAIFCLLVELAGIAYFTLGFREIGTSHRYELEMFWSYKEWIFGGNVELGMEVINNIALFFPLGFLLNDALKKASFWKVLMLSMFLSIAVESTQLVYKIGLFELDDIINNTMGAMAGWCLFHILRSPVRNRCRVPKKRRRYAQARL